MGRKILALIVGMIAAVTTIAIIRMLSIFAVTPPTGDVMQDPEKMKAFIAAMPIEGWIVVLSSYVLGSLAGGFIATKMSRRESPGIMLPLIIGMVLTAFGFYTVVQFPHPTWFIAASLLVYIPFALIGHKVAR